MNEQNSIQFLLKAFSQCIVCTESDPFLYSIKVFSMPYGLLKSHNGSQQMILSFISFPKYFWS